jgi:ArsR family transcriptional regulator
MKTLVPIFSALSDHSRLRILSLLLSAGDLCVCDIERTLRFTQTKVSRHMRYLRRAGLVRSRKSGRWVIYSMIRPGTVEGEIVLSGLRTILATTDIARIDMEALRSEIKNGCCVGPRLRVAGTSPKKKTER